MLSDLFWSLDFNTTYSIVTRFFGCSKN